MIRTAEPADAPAIAGIYNHYVSNTIVTFEEEVLEATEMARRVADTLEAGLPWLVIVEDGILLGYSYASKWKSRSAYRYTLETSVYLDQSATGRGRGTQLFSALIDAIRPYGAHALIGCVALPNPGSVRLLEKHGFVETGRFREVGRKLGRWIDVGYWELIL
jgi:L-amino acid N-acyltransferase YncA